MVLEYAGIVLIAFFFALVLGFLLIPTLRRLKIGQTIRSVGPKSHLQKKGTPTMGGLIFIVAASVVTVVFMPHSPFGYLSLILTMGFGAIGFADDYLKVVLKRPLGLKARHKLVGQIVLTVIFYILLRALNFEEYLWIPWLGKVGIGWAYPVLLMLVLVGTVNATNLSDGIDGLAGGLGVITFLGYALLCHFQGSLGLTFFSLSYVGGILGFLVFNLHPAKVFMGDTGSLAIGGGIAALAVLTHTEILLLFAFGIVFVVEAISVILQVASFQLTGRRIFLMAPIHHHYELKGWSEWKVCLVFWLIQLAGVALAMVIWLASR